MDVDTMVHTYFVLLLLFSIHHSISFNSAVKETFCQFIVSELSMSAFSIKRFINFRKHKIREILDVNQKIAPNQLLKTQNLNETL